MLVGPNYLVRKIDPPMFVFLCNAVILRKISKIGATRCQILRLKYTMLGLCPDPAGRVQWSPRPPTVFKGSTSKGREGKGSGAEGGREGKEKVRGRGGKERREGGAHEKCEA